jgi:hypothetical protein
MKFFILLITILSFSSFSFGQKDTLKQTIDTLIFRENNNAELNAYKLLYETTKRSNDELRETTHWTIGIVIAFILVILGSQFLYNWKINKQEIAQIKNEIDLRFQELQNSLSNGKDKIYNKLKNDIDNARKENQEYLSDKFDKSQTFAEKLNEIFQKEIERDILQLKTETQKLDADIWLIKGVEANALTGFVKTAEYKLDLGQELKYILDDIIPILTKMEEIHETEYNNLDRLLLATRQKFPDKYESQLTKIEQAYKNKQTYIYQDSRFTTGLMSGFSNLFSSKKIIRPKK